MAFTRDDLRQIGELIRPVRNRVRNVVAKAVVGIVDESKKLQLVQLGILKGEDGDGFENFQGYGFKSVPLPGAEAVAVFPDGDRGVGLVVGTEDRRHRPTGWAGGEAGLYNAFGAIVRLMASGVVELGGIAAVDFAVKGTAYRTAEDTMLTALAAAFTALAAEPTLTASAATSTAAATAISTFQAAAATYLATKVKVE